MTWSYVDAWADSAGALDVKVIPSFLVTLLDGVMLEAEMLVEGFGASIGTLVFEKSDMYWERLDDLLLMGLTASSFGPYSNGERESVAGMIEVLSDWGWSGEGSAPAWLERPSSD